MADLTIANCQGGSEKINRQVAIANFTTPFPVKNDSYPHKCPLLRFSPRFEVREKDIV